MQILARRKNAAWSDQTANLKDERIECRKINQPECPQENPARIEMAAAAVLWIEEPAHNRARFPLHERSIIRAKHLPEGASQRPAKDKAKLGKLQAKRTVKLAVLPCAFFPGTYEQHFFLFR